jgi:hypothetical protein
MARSRRTNCGHAADGPLYRVEEPVGYDAPDPTALQEALVHLADVLNALPGPLEGALAELTPPLLHKMFSRAALPARTHALHALGMPKMAPRTVGQALCRDVLGRLQRAHLHDAGHACVVLTSAPRRLLWMKTVSWDDDGRAAPDDLLETGDEWPAPVLRVALWSSLAAAVSDARMLLWAGTQSWWLPPGLSDAHGEAVLAAAQQVVEASPDFNLFEPPTIDRDGDDLDEDAVDSLADGAGRPTGVHDRPSPQAIEAEPTDMEPADTELTETVLSRTASMMPAAVLPAASPLAGADVLPAALHDRDVLTAAQVAASAAISQLRADVDAGRRPADTDLAAVVRFAEQLDALARLLADAEGTAPAALSSIATVDTALARLQHVAERASVANRLMALHRLAPAAPNPALTTQLAALHATVNDVVAHTSDAEPQLVGALLALIQLAELLATIGPAQANPADLMTLQADAAGGLPAALALLPVAVLTGQLVLGAATDTVITTTATVDDATAPVEAATDDATMSPTDAQAGIGAGTADTAGTDTAQTDVDSTGADDSPTAPAETGTVDPLQPAPAAAEVSGPTAANTSETTPPTGLAASAAPPAPTSAPPPAPELLAAATAGTAHHDAEVTATVADLVVDGRFGLAAAIADADGWSAGRGCALRLAALADAVRGETGPSAARLRAELSDIDAAVLAGEAATLLLSAPALLRAALVIGDPTAGALLTELAPRLADDLGVVAEQVGRRALQGVLIGNPLRTVLADVTELEARLDAARAAATDRLTRPRTLRFKRATDIAHRWLAAEGLLGELLSAAATDDRSKVGAVTASVLQLSDHGTMAKEIDALDKVFKGNSGKPIEGAGRQDLFTLAADALAQVSSWIEAVAALQAASSAGDTWATGELTGMRTAVLDHADAALAALDEQTPRDDTLAGAAAVAARASLERTFAVLGGAAALPPGEVLPDVALTGELLKVPGAHVEPTSGLVTTPDGTDVAALIAAAAVDWPAAFTAKLGTEEYPAAEYLLTTLQAGVLPGLGDAGIDLADAERRLAAAEHRSREQLQHERDQLLAGLRRARLHNEISEEQDDELTAMLDAADPSERRDLDVVRRQLAAVGELLPHYREEAAGRLQERLRVLAKQPGSRVPVDVAHIQRLIDDGLLSTAEELIYFLEIGEPVPSAPPRTDLAQFFPAVPDALTGGLTPAVVDAARTGGAVEACPELDFASLSPETRADVAAALEAWRLAGSTPPEGRARVDDRAVLLGALRLAGFEFAPSTKATRLEVQKGRERRFVELTDVSWNGRAIVPQFGSKLGWRLRVLLVWGQPAEDLLMSWVDHDTSGEAIVVAYFGTMPAAVRRRLAARTVRTDAPVVVLDDAAMAYLAAYGARQLDATMAVLLPFSAVQPYVRHKRSLVAPEMFYGRDSERKAVVSPEGTQVIFGGRGLGKSALMRDAKAVFEREPGRIAIHIELTTAEIGPNQQGADAVWDVLLRDLEAAGVVASVKAARRAKNNHEIVRAGVLNWLAADARHRLLILLDESDGFFEADAPRFLETNRLKDLGQLPGVEGRAKVVFAGLHSVQRFAKMSNNTFKHLAQRPTVIGPLRPQFAYNLIARPMEALGYTFADPDLVNRILGDCSYQPFLLQMFGHRLVEHMHGKRAVGVSDVEPPFTVTRADVEAVVVDPELKADITSTFSDTLNLDARYNVIANVLAWHAYEHGMDARLSDVELREECRAYWPAGFDALDVEGFRAYLQEMHGLGLLAPNNDGHGWHLRSPNVLRMIGTREAVLTELVHAADAAVPSEFIAMATRRPLPDGTRAPLTAAQVGDLLGDHANQVRLVLGSEATGIGRVGATLRAVCDDLAGRYTLVDARNRRQFDEALVAGRPGERRVVLSDLQAIAARDAACTDALATALEHRPTASGVTRAVVLVAGPEQLPFWREALAHAERPGFGVVSLRRFDRTTLRVWSLDTGRFATEERQSRLLATSGGWPALVERAVTLAAQHESEDGALVELGRDLASADGAGALVAATGLTVDDDLATVFDHITALVDAGATLADLHDAASLAGHLDPMAAVACLDALGVFDVDEAGTYRVAPLLVQCWPFRRTPTAVG